jgi:hypothetical protein
MLGDYANKVWSKDFAIDHTLTGNNEHSCGCILCVPLDVMTDGRILRQMNGHNGHRWLYFDPPDRSCQLAEQKGFLAGIYAENLVLVSGF